MIFELTHDMLAYLIHCRSADRRSSRRRLRSTKWLTTGRRESSMTPLPLRLCFQSGVGRSYSHDLSAGQWASDLNCSERVRGPSIPLLAPTAYDSDKAVDVIPCRSGILFRPLSRAEWEWAACSVRRSEYCRT